MRGRVDVGSNPMCTALKSCEDPYPKGVMYSEQDLERLGWKAAGKSPTPTYIHKDEDGEYFWFGPQKYRIDSNGRTRAAQKAG